MPRVSRDQAPYVPALGFRWLTRLYDPVVRLTLRDARFKARLVAQAGLRVGQRVLDLGCGTGSLTTMLKAACPGTEVAGLDGDREVLGVARSRAARLGLQIGFWEALATDPPFGPDSFDRVVSSLLFHHLLPADKRRVLDKVLEKLKPGGELHVADWGRPHGALMRGAFVAVQLLDGFRTTADSVAGLLPAHMSAAGFTSVSETHRQRTVLGTLAFYRAVKPDLAGRPGTGGDAP